MLELNGMLAKIEDDVEVIVRHIENLIGIPSPTGYTDLFAERIINYAQSHDIPFERTRKGAVFLKLETESAESNVMFAAHGDTLGCMVKETKPDGLVITPVGGLPAIYAIGDYCNIHASDGNIYTGTILPNNPAKHTNDSIEKTVPGFASSFVRVDQSFDTSHKLEDKIQVGDFVSLDPHFQYREGFIKSRFLDDKASCGIFLYMADILRRINLSRNVYLFFNTTEETSQGIAGFPPVDDIIVVDMGVVGDGCTGDERHVSICAKDRQGPYNGGLTRRLIELSKANNLAYKVDVFPFYGSDGTRILQACKDARVALMGQGVSASHGYERTHIDAIINTAKLMYLFTTDQIQK